MNITMTDNRSHHPRARDVVKLAASRVTNTFVRKSLLEDDKGVFEKEAGRLLNHEGARQRMVDLDKTEEDLVQEAADVLALNSLTAALSVLKKGR